MFYRIKGVDESKCNGCEKCVQACHAKCFEMMDSGGKIIANFNNKEKCDACADCIIICPVNGSAIILAPVNNEKKGFVKSIDNKKCVACEKCLKLCPGKNIEIVEENGKIFARIIDPKKCVADGYCSFCCDVDDKTYSKDKCVE